MKRTLVTFSVVALMAFSLGGCEREKDCNVCTPYCDDSGCYNCDGSGCWQVENPPCQDELQCAANEVCTEYGCARPCSFDLDCGTGEQCLASGYCGPAIDIETPCTQDEDCGSGMICEDDVCIDGCQSDEDCEGGLICGCNYRCVEPEDSCGVVVCQTDAECGEGRICLSNADETQKICAYECDMADPVCPRGQVCDASVCMADPAGGTECAGMNSQCDAMAHCTELGCQCVNGYCYNLCESGTDCAANEICDFSGDPAGLLGSCKANYRPEE